MPQNSPQSNSDPDEESPIEEALQSGDEEKIWPITRLYFKIGGYFKISFKEFRETPWPIIKQCSMLLDEKQADMNQFIGHEEASVFKNLKRMFASEQPDK